MRRKALGTNARGLAGVIMLGLSASASATALVDQTLSMQFEWLPLTGEGALTPVQPATIIESASVSTRGDASFSYAVAPSGNGFVLNLLAVAGANGRSGIVSGDINVRVRQTAVYEGSQEGNSYQAQFDVSGGLPTSIDDPSREFARLLTEWDDYEAGAQVRFDCRNNDTTNYDPGQFLFDCDEMSGLFGGTGWISFTPGDESPFAETSFHLSFLAERVPEPGTLALLGLGLAGIGLSRRRRAS